MTKQNSILDKLIASKQREEAVGFNPLDLVSGWLDTLSQKEKEILIRRFSLLGKEKETLEQIGKTFAITRERVRQIETGAIKRLKELKDFQIQIETVQYLINHLLEERGGIMEEGHFLEELLNYSDATSENKKTALFIASQLLDELERIKPQEEINAGWRLKSVSLDILLNTLNELVAIIQKENRLLALEDLVTSLKQREFFEDFKNQIFSLGLKFSEESFLENELEKIIYAYLKISRKINQSILGKWGLSSWNTVIPKRMADKIYLVLKKENKPLHFTEIAKLINQLAFDKKTAYPATIHNELILDPRFILVGRGIYALKEWGYYAGAVSEVISKILTESVESLTKKEIVEKVLKQRLVKPTTIYLALTNKNKFQKSTEGKYSLKQ